MKSKKHYFYLWLINCATNNSGCLASNSNITGEYLIEIDVTGSGASPVSGNNETLYID